jgi:hypothetical protein
MTSSAYAQEHKVINSKHKKIRATTTGMLSSSDQEVAQEYFNEGKYEECVHLVDSLKNNFSLFSKQTKQDLLILKVKALLEQDKISEAEAATKELFRFNPHYELDLINNNTEDYNRMIKSFDIHPLLSLGVRNSLLMPTFRVSKINSVLAGVNYDAPYSYSSHFLMYYGWAEYQLKANLSINIDLVYWGLNYSRMLHGPTMNINYNESMKFIETPIYIKRYLLIPVPVFKDILPYVTGGFSYLYMTQAFAYASYGSLRGTGANDNIDVLPMRNQNEFEWLCGAGIGYKIKNLRIFLDWRYYGGINSFTNDARRLDNQLLNSTYAYTDNKVTLSKSEIGASISLTFKNSISKKKKADPQAQLILN